MILGVGRNRYKLRWVFHCIKELVVIIFITGIAFAGTSTCREERMSPASYRQPWTNISSKTAMAESLALPLLAKAGLLNEGGRTVAPLKALSRWLCCLANCSSVSSSRILWSRSTCKAFCQRLLWFWASDRKSRHALKVIKQNKSVINFKGATGSLQE